jgi:hypothetical protein
MARAADDLDAETPAAPLLRAEFRLVDAILGMAGSHPIALFVKCLYRYGGLISQPVHAHPSRIVPWRDARLALVEAILESDGEVAMIVSDRIARLLAAWLD